MFFILKYAVFLPASWLYAAVVWVRNRLFDFQILKSEKFDFSTICVGNITVGGTGKTPHTEFLLSLLLKNNFRPAMLSRGYKRLSNGFQISTETATAETLGDEPFQIFRKFPTVVVAVDKNRRRALKKLREMPIDAVVLDDAMQHRFVQAGLTILLIDSRRPIYADFPLPFGRLRESPTEIRRADIVVFTKCKADLQKKEAAVFAEKLQFKNAENLFFTTYRYGEIYPVFSGENFVADAVLVLTGIAAPKDLYEFVKNNFAEFHAAQFPDHHAFSLENWQKIATQFSSISNPKKIILTTEKDAARIISDKNVPENLKKYIFAIPINVEFLFDKENLFNQKILDYVKKNNTNRRISQN